MSISRYEPWNVMSHLQGEINRIFSNATDANAGSSSATADWAPPVDVHECADRFEIFVDVPGVDPKAVEITLDNGVLTLSGECSFAQRATGEEQLLRQRGERSQGRFHRRFILPETVDAERVSAKGRNGVLELVIAK